MKGNHQLLRYMREVPEQPLRKAISQVRLSSHTDDLYNYHVVAQNPTKKTESARCVVYKK